MPSTSDLTRGVPQLLRIELEGIPRFSSFRSAAYLSDKIFLLSVFEISQVKAQGPLPPFEFRRKCQLSLSRTQTVSLWCAYDTVWEAETVDHGLDGMAEKWDQRSNKQSGDNRSLPDSLQSSQDTQ